MSPSIALARQIGVVQNVAARVGCLMLVLVAAGCGQVTAPSAQVTAGSSAPQVTSSAAPAPSDLPLDAASRDLLAVMDPADSAHIVVGTTWTDELSTAALRAGTRSQVFEPGGSIALDGPVGDTLALLNGIPVTSVTIQESMEAMRPIPVDRLIVDVLTPGRPYLVVGFGQDLTEVAIRSPQREAMLQSLAQTIQTIDGQPYARLRLEGSCGSDKIGPSCGVIAVGFTSGSAGREDDWSLRATPRTGPGGAIEGVLTASVPRSLLRAAEWSARHDEAALARIRAFTGCCSVSWDPAQPGRITLVYDRPCATTFVEGRDLADTGQCMDELSITVDVRSGAVVSIEGPAGP